jgi:hypothetical protein
MTNPNLKLSAKQIRDVSKAASVDARTLLRYLCGERVRLLAGERIHSALAAAGLLALILLSACGYSPTRPAALTSPDAGGGAGGAVSASSPVVSPDAGLPPDALVQVDARPADALAPQALDTMPARQPDAWTVPDTLVQVEPDAQVVPVDTRRTPDAMPMPGCTWHNEASGWTANVYGVENTTRCGIYGSTACHVGCTVQSVIAAGAAEKITPSGQTVQPSSVGFCRARVAVGDADPGDYGLCFVDAATCAKFCQ